MYKQSRTVAGRGADVVGRRVARADAPGAQDVPRAQAVERAGGGVARVPLQALPLLSLPARATDGCRQVGEPGKCWMCV